ncbi:MAG: hypothetical protein FD123_4070 [Bacteroidetes bacterium]|nr:MAG: hypothetical protein FD123_4070 [Bacteroidota bacterium]
MKLFIIFSPLLFLLPSCEGHKQNTVADTIAIQAAPPAKENFPVGNVLQLHCKNDSTNRFALYLPTGYDNKKEFPLLLFFDPHADGTLPLEKYKRIAEKYGVLLAGSNVSKNGMDFNTTGNLVNTLLADLQNRLPVDSLQIFLCGFSGGARVAGMIALNHTGIAGVIGCSASLPGNSASLPFYYTGIAGLCDMNYLEMRTQHQQMDSLKTPHAFLLFPGKHEWAPVQTMDDAFAFQFCRTDGSKKSAVNLSESMLRQSNYLVKNGQMPAAADLLHDAISSLEGLCNTEKLQKKNDSLIGHPDFKRAMAVENKILREENYFQRQFASAISSENMDWFEQFFKGIDTSLTSKKAPVYFMRKRTWAYMSLVCYSYCNQAFQQGNLQVIGHYTDLYKRVDPQNSEWAYMKAKLAMMSSDRENALAALETCAGLGFKDRARLEQEPAFKPLFTEKRFQEILKSVGK